MAKEVSIAEFRNSRYIRLSKIIGEKKALYCLCAVFNVAFDPDIECVTFDDYIDQVGVKKFEDGVIDSIIGNVEDKELMDRWKVVWGVGDPKKPYTEEDYRQLDNKFEMYSARLEKAGGMDEQQEDTLRTCSRMRLEADKYVAKGGKDNIDMASKLSKMVQDMLASEQLRKKDEKQAVVARWDGITDIIARKYGVDVEMSYEDAKKIVADWMVSHHYPVTMDAAEHMYLAMLNTARMNDDKPEITELPEEMKIPEGFAHEFEAQPNQEEKEAYEYLSIKPFKMPTL